MPKYKEIRAKAAIRPEAIIGEVLRKAAETKNTTATATTAVSSADKCTAEGKAE